MTASKCIMKMQPQSFYGFHHIISFTIALIDDFQSCTNKLGRYPSDTQLLLLFNLSSSFYINEHEYLQGIENILEESQGHQLIRAYFADTSSSSKTSEELAEFSPSSSFALELLKSNITSRDTAYGCTTKFTLHIPLHIRYHAPDFGPTHQLVNITLPSIYLSHITTGSSDSNKGIKDNTNINDFLISDIYESLRLNSRIYKRLYCGEDSSVVIALHVPIGDMSLKSYVDDVNRYVTTTTVLILLTSLLYLFFSRIFCGGASKKRLLVEICSPILQQLGRN